MMNAPCSDNPELWFSGLKQHIDVAKKICATCPLRMRCLEDALEYEALSALPKHGVFGGLTPGERTRLTARKRVIA